MTYATATYNDLGRTGGIGCGGGPRGSVDAVGGSGGAVAMDEFSVTPGETLTIEIGAGGVHPYGAGSGGTGGPGAAVLYW